MREQILEKIRELAIENGGKPPGKAVFARVTGITEAQWSGVIWARWSDALEEAGYRANELQQRFESADVLTKVIEACRHYGRLPTVAELKLYRRTNPAFPSKGTIAGHFRSRAELVTALARRAAEDAACADIAAMLPSIAEPLTALNSAIQPRGVDGFVYLLKSGEHYKIGRSDDLERRVKEVRVALPEAVTLVHAIRTDDPAGIEAYWHRRFADRRANGEWFKLSSSDVTAFSRRRSQ